MPIDEYSEAQAKRAAHYFLWKVISAGDADGFTDSLDDAEKEVFWMEVSKYRTFHQDPARETPGFSHGEERALVDWRCPANTSREPSKQTPDVSSGFSREGRAEQDPAGVEDVRHSEPFEVRVRSEPRNPPGFIRGDAVKKN